MHTKKMYFQKDKIYLNKKYFTKKFIKDLDKFAFFGYNCNVILLCRFAVWQNNLSLKKYRKVFEKFEEVSLC